MNFTKGKSTYRFLYYDAHLKKNIRLKRSEIPPIQNDEEAEAFCQKWKEENGSRSETVRLKTRWKELAPEFMEILSLFESARKEDAEFSWQSYSYYLSSYVFPFYLEVLNLKDINQWADYFEDFRDHLKSVKRINRSSQETLHYSTMNGVIKALNSFLTIMHRRRKAAFSPKCRPFAKSKLKFKNEQSVMSPEQWLQIYLKMQNASPLAAKYFYVSVHTGTRLNELFGVSLTDFHSGDVAIESLQKCLKDFPMKEYGYISLDSQPRLMRRFRDASQEVPRKPLKGKKHISGENSRTIAVFDQRCFDILVELWNQQRILFEEKKYGSNPRDYLLFNGLFRNTYIRIFKSAWKELEIEQHFTPHDARHTYSTWLAEKSGGDLKLCKMVLGHSSEKTTMGYVHFAARIHESFKTSVQLQMPMALSTETQKTVSLESKRMLKKRSNQVVRFPEQIRKKG